MAKLAEQAQAREREARAFRRLMHSFHTTGSYGLVLVMIVATYVLAATLSQRSLAVLEALAGQLFLVTAVAKIVSAWRPRVWRESSQDADGESTSDWPT